MVAYGSRFTSPGGPGDPKLREWDRVSGSSHSSGLWGGNSQPLGSRRGRDLSGGSGFSPDIDRASSAELNLLTIFTVLTELEIIEQSRLARFRVAFHMSKPDLSPYWAKDRLS